jgi:hypothetical protein
MKTNPNVKLKKMQRTEITSFLNELLVTTRLSGIGKHYASEVTLDYGHKKGEPKRIDFVQFKPANTYSISGIERGEFIGYEVKSCVADVFSGNGLNIECDRNYIVTTMETWKKLIELEQNNKKELPPQFGVMVACYKDKINEFYNPTPISEIDGWRLEVLRNAHAQSRKRSVTELLFCMLRSGKK